MNTKLKHIIECGVWRESVEKLARQAAIIQEAYGITESDLIAHMEIITDYLKGDKSYSLDEL